jgi:hypothetical protein
MKKDRNCMYPIYPGMIPAPIPINYQMPTNNTDYSNLANQISNLEKRVSRLEGLVSNTTTYNDSNFYMV